MGGEQAEKSVRPHRRQQIGPAIRTLRQKRGWSQNDLAQHAGLSASHLSRLERGASVPSYQLLARLASVLGVEVSYFTTFERTATELDQELAHYLEQLRIPPSTWPEFSHLGLEARGALIDALRRLTAPEQETISRLRALKLSILTNGVAASIPAILDAIAEFGLAPVEYERCHVQIEEMPGNRLVLIDRLATQTEVANLDQLQLFRLIYGVELPDPLLLKWWGAAIRSALRATLAEHSARTIYPIAEIERYLDTGTWGVSVTLTQTAVREAVQTTIDLLRSNPRYQIGLIDKAPPIGFLVKGTGGTLVRPLGTLAAPDVGEQPKIGLRFSSTEITTRFREYFETLWDSIPPERKESDAVIEWLESRLAALENSR